MLLSHGEVTKRTILSDIARMYDPLGITGPIILTAKVMLQQLWQKDLGWDDFLTEENRAHWTEFRNQLISMHTLEVKRCVIPSPKYHSIELHGFCDASLVGYGACVYVRCIPSEGEPTMTLVCSKSRVAPLKALTIPRLELCGALLLSQLIKKVGDAMKVEFNKTFLWTDSTIVLAWIKTESKQLKTFVSHRIADIQNLTNLADWHHIPTDENPADLISRGLMPNQLPEASLWWNGPTFLTDISVQWPSQQLHTPNSDILEFKTSSMVICDAPPKFPVLSKYSSFSKLQRVASYVKRFISNCQTKIKLRKKLISQEEFDTEMRNGDFTAQELLNGTKLILHMVQREEFKDDLGNLSRQRSLHRKSVLKGLNVFLDNDNIIRVGGRIRNSTQCFDTKHQIVLPKGHHVTKLLIRHLHVENAHAGQQALLSHVRQSYWPIGAKGTIRQVTRGCVHCFKRKPRTVEQFMGELPVPRVQICHPFLRVGVDYAGPVLLKMTRNTTVKAYIAIFVCMSTKAVHIELVSDLSSVAFIAALTRFISRRGYCQHIYSDNGSNFVGARTELRRLYDTLADPICQTNIKTFCSQKAIEFHFNPPSAPSMGGLWEGAVKSAKYHLVRIAGNTLFNFEEMQTVLIKIEAILNSRPLIPESSDPEDVTAITPGHFLIGRPLVALMEPNYIDVNVNRLRRWQLIQKVTQHFWNRWSVEYLTTLQHRPTTMNVTEIKEGALALIRDDALPPTQWCLGRIAVLHPGRDNITRVVSLKTKAGILKRPVSKIALLPLL